jgi:hypothetical protein
VAGGLIIGLFIYIYIYIYICSGYSLLVAEVITRHVDVELFQVGEEGSHAREDAVDVGAGKQRHIEGGVRKSTHTYTQVAVIPA